MKTNVRDVESDWLLKLSCRNSSDTYEFQYVLRWNKTKEEIMAIADSYCSSDTVVRVYKLEDVLSSLDR